ncbi:MAG: glutathione S-transferase N-terminal domain-containing protein, partial [Pseudomonadota bacterium]
MQLLISPASPFVRKVRVLLREADLLDDVDEVLVSTTPLASDPTVLAANPTGKIPALIRDDRPAIYDSRVITRFLDDRGNAGLYPAQRIWEILTLEATA